jgi:Histidine kinase-, DNA gyrase B-, and HSP90-like ATPase
MSDINAVSIKIQTGVYGQFRNLNNKVWFALGEYVDNAVQSFENNKERLSKAHKGKYQFEVKIDIDWEYGYIKIHDNAAGIDSKNFPRAFEPANIPIDNLGLNEFGMGMKTASIWLADLWSVKTAALDEIVERFVEFDLKKVVKEEKEDLKVINTSKLKTLHFTEVTLNNLSNNAPSSYQMEKIKKHLASIYRKFILSGDMKLYINNDELIYEEPEILNAPFHSLPNSRAIEWKKEISFKWNKYHVKGFIGILNTMSTTELNGLSLFRRGRVIEGSFDEKYRPKVICGQTGSPRYKRIFGELELEGFAVSFNKGSFQEQEDLDGLMEAVKMEISAKNFNLYEQAQEYTKPKNKEDNIKVAKDIVTSLRKTSNETYLKEKVKISLDEINDKSIAINNERLTRKATTIETHEDTIEIENKKYKLKLVLITEPKILDLYSFEIDEEKYSVINVKYTINLAHKFFNRFERLKNEDGNLPILSIVRALVLAEIHAPSQGTKNGGNVRINFNNFLRNI